MTMITRRRFLAAGTSVAAAGLFTGTRATAARAPDIRIGTVFPTKTGDSFVRASVNDYIGTAGRIGALLAETQLGTAVESQGASLDVLFTTSPTADVAIRAGERLVETGNIHALVGGVGEGQAQMLAEIATRARIPFFNIGETSDAFRREALSPYLFHIEASDAMYLDAMGQLAAREGLTRWIVAAGTDDHGMALAARAERAASKAGCTIVKSVGVPPAIPVYYSQVEEMAEVEADVIFVLVDYLDLFPLMVQMEEQGITTPVLNFPHTITQTRDFFAASRNRLPVLNPQYHLALWEATDTRAGAEDFNLQVRARYAEPADPTAWAAYHAIKIIVDTVLATGSTEASAMIAYLEDPATTFDLAKGPGVSFRPWDHQLRQPLAVVEVDNDVVWRERELPTRIAIGRYAGSLPVEQPGSDTASWLDSLGDGPEED